jgi:hypothetical protein
MKNPVKVNPELKYPPTPVTEEQARHYMFNAVELTGKTWEQAVDEYFKEMDFERNKAGMKPWQNWGGK